MSQDNHHLLQSISREMGHLQADVKALRVEVTGIREKQDEIVNQTNRWKGGFIVLICIGGMFGWISDF